MGLNTVIITPQIAQAARHFTHLTENLHETVWQAYITPGVKRSQVLVNDLLQLVISNQHQGTSSTTKHIGSCTLEERLAALL